MNPLMMVLILIALLILFFLVGIQHEKTTDERIKQKISKQFPQKCKKDYSQRDFDVMHQSLLDYIQIQEKQNSISNHDSFLIDDITWNDLEVDEIIKYLDFSRSMMGFFGLYRWLRYLCFDPEVLDIREKKISFFQNHLELVQAFLLQCEKVSFIPKSSVFEFYQKDDKKVPFPMISLLLDFGMILAVVAAFLFDSRAWFALIGIIVLQMLRYPSQKKIYDPIVKKIGFVLSLTQNFTSFMRYEKDFDSVFASDFSKLKEIFANNKKNQRKAIIFQFSSSKSATGDLLNMIFLYLNMMFHFDMIIAKSMQNEVEKGMDDIVVLMDVIGDMEAAITIAHVRSCFSDTCIPVLTKASGFDDVLMTGLYHPLVEHPVSNDISFEQSILLTGSNASGKSTFMKSVAVNILLSQTIHTTFARAYEGVYTRLYSSMALRDHLLQKESYFVVELKSMKRIMDGVQDANVPVFIVIDEILRGTNTKERIAASTSLLQELCQKHIFVIAATHDVELTSLLENDYANYHFAEYVKDKKVYFPYQIEAGPATGRNALALMKSFGFDETVLKRANDYL